MKTDLFQSCGHCWVFQICWFIDCSTFIASSIRIGNSSTGIPSPPLALFVVMLPKAHLTSHSRMAGSRWVITSSWLSRSWRWFCIVLQASLVAQLVKNLPAMQETLIPFWVRKILCRRGGLLTPVFLGFPCGSATKESTCNVGDLGSIPGLGRSPGEGKGYPLQYSGLENSMNCIVHGVTKSQTRLSDFHFILLLCILAMSS